ncbi:MAG: hypothetical protein L3J39_08460 [Verrucomicrobiales bacterium]|nr:hypothetical protein [Verrucomicrobiales bacterium]
MKNWLLILLGTVAIQHSQAQKTDRRSGGEVKTVHERNLAVLKYVARRQKNYGVMYVAKPDSEHFQINRVGSLLDVKLNYILKVGETSPDKVFRVDGYNGKDVLITYLPDERKFQLELKVPKHIPNFFAQFRQAIGAEGEKKEDFYVKKGDFFKLSINSKLEYTLVDVEPKKVVISFQSELGKEKIIEIKVEK